jgi:hydrogenase maturation protease
VGRLDKLADRGPQNTVIMGIGNLLMGDDGVGVHAARALMINKLPHWVTVLDVGMAFLEALSSIEKTERIIILDAMMASGEPGTVYRSMLHECSAPERIDSLHNFDVFRLLALAQNDKPNTIVVFGVEPDEIKWSMDLSPKVSASIPLLVEAVCREIGLDNINKKDKFEHTHKSAFMEAQ